MFYHEVTLFGLKSILIMYHKIGPDLNIIISIIWGGLLGDCHAERRKTANGKPGNTRISFKQSGRNIQYLYFNWNIFSKSKYCSLNKPKIKKTIGKKGKIYMHVRFNTYTYSKFNWIHDLWYDKNNYKILPSNDKLYQYVNEQSFATWIMDHGHKTNEGGLILHTNNFSKDEVERLIIFLKKKFNIASSLRKQKKNKPQTGYYYLIYVSEMSKVKNLVSPYFSEHMIHKLK